jgi:long-chain acyl-CoA synthetase
LTFSTAQHHEAITSDLHQAYRGNALAKLVSGSKLNDLANGHISRDSIWDKLVWRSLRNNAIGGLAGDRLRALIIVYPSIPFCKIEYIH